MLLLSKIQHISGREQTNYPKNLTKSVSGNFFEIFGVSKNFQTDFVKDFSTGFFPNVFERGHNPGVCLIILAFYFSSITLSSRELIIGF